MASTHGRIVDSYGLGTERWVVVWDFDSKEKISFSVDDEIDFPTEGPVAIEHSDNRVSGVRLADGRRIIIPISSDQ